MQIQEFVRAGIRRRPTSPRRGRRWRTPSPRVAAENNYAVSLAQLTQRWGCRDTTYTLADGELPPVRGEDAPPATLVTKGAALRARAGGAGAPAASAGPDGARRCGGVRPSLAATAGPPRTAPRWIDDV